MARKAQRRGLKLEQLPYAEETRVVNDVFDFLAKRLPAFIEREASSFGAVWAEADVFRALSALPDSALKKAGIDRADLPALVLSAFHLIKVSRKRRKKSRQTAR